MIALVFMLVSNFILFFFRRLFKSPKRSFTMDIKPNHTIYINNLNEKVKKDGENMARVASPDVLSLVTFRVKKVALRHFLAVRGDSRCCRNENIEGPRTGVCCFQGD